MSETTAEDLETLRWWETSTTASGSISDKLGRVALHLRADLEAAEERLDDLDLSCARCGQEHERELAVCSGCAKALTEEREEAEGHARIYAIEIRRQEDRAQKAEARAVVADGQAGARAEKLTIMSRVLAAAEARVKELEAENPVTKEHIKKRERAYAVRVLEGAQIAAEKRAQEDGSAQGMSFWMARATGFGKLADRIKEGKA